MLQPLKQTIKSKLPPPALQFYFALRVYPNDPLRVLSFLASGWATGLSIGQRMKLVKQLYAISLGVESPHSQFQMLQVIETILLSANATGCIVEAGCFKGGSTAKFSLAAAMVNKPLLVFDSFEGIPPNEEDHGKSIKGRHVGLFEPGSYAGSLPEVQRNVSRYGVADVCRFVPGWFEDTMPHLTEDIAVAYVDVDLVSSTKTCLKYLYPRLLPGGVMFSQDGHLPLVVAALDDDRFWEEEVGCQKPPMEGLGTNTLVKIIKPFA